MVGKAYDDDLYAWVRGGGRDLEYEGLGVKVFEAYDLDRFERDNYYFEVVKDDVLEEALKGLRDGIFDGGRRVKSVISMISS